KNRRRGNRGGKRTREDGVATENDDAGETVTAVEAEVIEVVAVETVAEPVETSESESKPVKKPARKPRRGSKAAQAEAAAEATFEPAPVAFDVSAPEPIAAKTEAQAVPEDKPAADSKRSNRRKADSDAPTGPKLSSTVTAKAPEAEAQPKKGWWQRKSFF
ncbi:MAG: ribonuclease E/G, partial [Rhizobiaceae bacterium]